jgi:hypothetical protein
MSEKIPAQFRKTKTEKWAVMAPVEDLEKALADGGKIEVQRRSGDWSTFTVASLGRPFDLDGVSMCYGYAPGDEEPVPSDQGAGSSRSSGPASGGPSGASSPASSGSRSTRPARARPEPPSRDDHEPLPDYRGGPEDEWGGEF